MTRVPLVLALSAAVVLPQGQEEPAFRASADLVSVHVAVTDGRGRFVPGLSARDFTVYDNGMPRAILHFSNERQPVAVVVMLDRSGSMFEHFDLVTEAGLAFVAGLGPDDGVRVGSFSTDVSIRPATFTSDREELRAALSEGASRGSSPVWTALDQSVTALEQDDRRRVILLLSDGHSDPEPIGPSDVIARARAADVTIYSVGLGLRVRSRTGWQPPPRLPEPPRFPLPPGRGGWSLPRPAPSAQRTRTEPPDPRLREIAVETGGVYFELRNSGGLRQTFAAIAEDLHHQYRLGFAPTRLDGQVHRLDVRVSNADFNVRARRSYFAKAAATD